MSESPAFNIFTVRWDQSERLLVAEPETDWKFLSGHIHTTRSDGRMSPPQVVDEALRVGADVFAVTDHDTISGSSEAQQSAGDRIPALIGAEVSSADGHILAIGLKENKDIPPGRSAEYTVEAIHAQGGVALIAHPDVHHIDSVTSTKLSELVRNPEQKTRPDGVEVHNGSVGAVRKVPVVGRLILSTDPNGHAKLVRTSLFPSGTAFGGADAHSRKLDKVITGFKGEDPVAALRNGETAVFINPSAINARAGIAEAAAIGRGAVVLRARKFRSG